MLFNSHEFLFLFFPLTLLGYWVCTRIAKKSAQGAGGRLPSVFLLAASLLFYVWNGPQYLPILLGSILANYGIGSAMIRADGNAVGKAAGMKSAAAGKKKWLFWGVCLNVGMLCFFKYWDLDGFFPLAVSFYTFSQIAFLMESFKGNVKNRDLLSYGLYVSYFPKMIQGPIALPEEMDRNGRRADWEECYKDLYLFVLGLFKKVLIADTFGKAVTYGYGNLSALNSLDGVIVMLAYTLQLYFDFSGYCDMAMGISGMLGISLPVNFHSPYQAANIVEFWKGWHITLTRFFTKYVYIPLGGNRKGRARTYVNTLIIFFLSGIWHGTGLQFIVWGMMHGVLYVLTRAFMYTRIYRRIRGFIERRRGSLRAIYHGVWVLVTFLYVNIAWVFFRAPSVKAACGLLGTILGGSGGRVNWDLAGCFNLDEFWYVIKVFHLDRWQYAHYICMVFIFLAVFIMIFFGKTAADYVKTVRPRLVHSVVMAVLFVWSVLSVSGVSSFLYVNF